jgi:hypothetical protein
MTPEDRREVLIMTATFQKDGSWWNGYFQDSRLIEKIGPYKDQQAAIADGPRAAKVLRKLLARNNVPIRELRGVNFPWSLPGANK